MKLQRKEKSFSVACLVILKKTFLLAFYNPFDLGLQFPSNFLVSLFYFPPAVSLELYTNQKLEVMVADLEYVDMIKNNILPSKSGIETSCYTIP
jgi:hypothetical protein